MSYMSEAEVNARAIAEGPAEPTPSVFIMGAGVVGTALAARLVRAGVPVIGLHGRQVELTDAARAISGVVGSTGEIPAILSESDVVIISVRDERIPEVAERLAKEGRLRRDAGAAAHLGRQPGAHDPQRRARRTCARSGRCTRWCRSPTRAWPSSSCATSPSASRGTSRRGPPPSGSCGRSGARAVFLEAENLPLYHAGAVHGLELRGRAGRHGAVAAHQGGRAGRSGAARADPAAVERGRRTWRRSGLPGALTGPVERGDVSSVERHLGTLAARAPELLELYRLVGRDVLRLAREKSKLDPASAARLEALFSGAAPARGPRRERQRSSGGVKDRNKGHKKCDEPGISPGSSPNIASVSTVAPTAQELPNAQGIRAPILDCRCPHPAGVRRHDRRPPSPRTSSRGRSSSPRTVCRCASPRRARSSAPCSRTRSTRSGRPRSTATTRGPGTSSTSPSSPSRSTTARSRSSSTTSPQGKKYVAGDPQYTRERGSRIFGSSIQLAKPEFDVRKHYMMTIESRGQIIADDHLLAAGQGCELQRQGRVLRRGNKSPLNVNRSSS